MDLQKSPQTSKHSFTDLYFAYIRERYDFEIISDENSFVVFEIKNEICFIHDIFVHPLFRRKKVGTNLADRVLEIARTRGCKRIFGTIDLKAKNAREALVAHFSWGLNIHSATSEFILTSKEI